MTEETLQRIEKYEIMLIFNPDIGEEGVRKELDEVKKNITAEGGEVFTEDFWGVRELTYRIKKLDQGFYVVINLNLPTESVREIEKMLNLHPMVVRFLLLKTPVNYQLKTFEEYKEEEELFKREEAKKKEEEDLRKKEKFELRGKKVERPKKIEKKAKEEIKKEIKEEEKEPEVSEEPKEAPKSKAKKLVKSKLEEVDEKLKSIIDNPDITL